MLRLLSIAGVVTLCGCPVRDDRVLFTIDASIPIVVHQQTLHDPLGCAPGIAGWLCRVGRRPTQQCSYGVLQLGSPSSGVDCFSSSFESETVISFGERLEGWCLGRGGGGTQRLFTPVTTSFMRWGMTMVTDFDDGGVIGSFPEPGSLDLTDGGCDAVGDRSDWTNTFSSRPPYQQDRIWALLDETERLSTLQRGWFIGASGDADEIVLAWELRLEELPIVSQGLVLEPMLEALEGLDGGFDPLVVGALVDHPRSLAPSIDGRLASLSERAGGIEKIDRFLAGRGEPAALQRRCAALGRALLENSPLSLPDAAAMALYRFRCPWIPEALRRELTGHTPFTPPEFSYPWCADDDDGGLATLCDPRQIEPDLRALLGGEVAPFEDEGAATLQQMAQAVGIKHSRSPLLLAIESNRPLSPELARQLERARYEVRGEGACVASARQLAARLPAEVGDAQTTERSMTCRIEVDDAHRIIRVMTLDEK